MSLSMSKRRIRQCHIASSCPTADFCYLPATDGTKGTKIYKYSVYQPRRTVESEIIISVEIIERLVVLISGVKHILSGTWLNGLKETTGLRH